MKVRFSGNSIRVRLSGEEFEKLVSGNTLEERTNLTESKALSFCVQRMQGESSDVELAFAFEGMCATLRINQAGIDALSSGDNRKGGVCKEINLGNGKDLECSLQVDIRSR